MAYKDKQKQKETRKEWRIENKERLEEQSKRYRKENKEQKKQYIKQYRLMKNYGITLDQHRQMFISQDGKCAICDIDFKSVGAKKVHVDHNHSTDQVRQLLCGNCNTMLGYANENTDTLLKAVDYLKKWNVR
jgi:hypothetical protein